MLAFAALVPSSSSVAKDLGILHNDFLAILTGGSKICNLLLIKPSPAGKGDRLRWMRRAKSVQIIGFLLKPVGAARKSAICY